jgi:hypothetical protein
MASASACRVRLAAIRNADMRRATAPFGGVAELPTRYFLRGLYVLVSLNSKSDNTAHPRHAQRAAVVFVRHQPIALPPVQESKQ